MQLQVEERGDIRIVRVQVAKLTYPTLSPFFAEVRQLVEGGTRKLVIDLQSVTYVDSASIGCLMDIYRLMQERSGAVKLSGVQPRVETMISMTGVQIGQIAWLATIGDQRYTTSATGKASGVLSVLVNGEGSVDVRGAVIEGRLAPRFLA